MNSKLLYELLREIPSKVFENEIGFVIDTFPKLGQILGYPDDSLMFEHRLDIGSREIADAVIINPKNFKPWLLIEAKGPRFRFGKMKANAEEQMERYIKVASPENAIMLSPFYLWMYRDGVKTEFNLEELTQEQADNIFERLSCPSDWPLQEAERPSSNDDSTIDFEYFSISRRELNEKIEFVDSASTNKEKGQSLEELSDLLFSSINGVTTKYNNLLGSSNEIDLVLEYKRSSFNPVFDEFGRYSLVECKNWAVPVGAKFVRDFESKLDKTKIKLGFLVSKNGVTGANGGADALREIHSAFDRSGTYIVVITRDDILTISSGEDFYSIIDNKIDRIRFDY